MQVHPAAKTQPVRQQRVRSRQRPLGVLLRIQRVNGAVLQRRAGVGETKRLRSDSLLYTSVLKSPKYERKLAVLSATLFLLASCTHLRLQVYISAGK